MFVNSDFSDLLRFFRDSGVSYVVIGGYAVIEIRNPASPKTSICG
jgi:hypothetical protein